MSAAVPAGVSGDGDTLKQGKAKLLLGAPRRSRWAPAASRRDRGEGNRGVILLLLAIVLFVAGGVAGFAWHLDREVRGGILRQRAEAARRPDWVPLESVSPILVRAMVSVVDPAFWSRQPMEEGAGGSTLSRDLIAQVHLLDSDLADQARILAMGPLLESRLPKRALLELYLNRVYLGRTDGYPVFGVGNAAREFFDKEPGQLSVAESATLAGLLLPPRIPNPEDRPGAVGARRNEILRRMLAEGWIDAATLQRALAEPLPFQPGLEFAPMSRPAGWDVEPAIIELPAPPDSAAAAPSDPP